MTNFLNKKFFNFRGNYNNNQIYFCNYPSCILKSINNINILCLTIIDRKDCFTYPVVFYKNKDIKQFINILIKDNNQFKLILTNLYKKNILININKNKEKIIYDIIPNETYILDNFILDNKFNLDITINNNLLEKSLWVVSDYININNDNNDNLEAEKNTKTNITLNYNYLQSKILEYTFNYSDYFFIRSLGTSIIKKNMNKDICMICNKNNTESYFYPCGHKCICDICYIKIKSNKIKKNLNDLECPLCYKTIYSTFYS